MSRYALLFPDGLELLPPVSAQQTNLIEGLHYQVKVSYRTRICWQESSLSWLVNPLASAIGRAGVRGDAVLQLDGPFASEEEVVEELIAILSKSCPRTLLREFLGNLRGFDATTLQAKEYGSGDGCSVCPRATYTQCEADNHNLQSKCDQKDTDCNSCSSSHLPLPGHPQVTPPPDLMAGHSADSSSAVHTQLSNGQGLVAARTTPVALHAPGPAASTCQERCGDPRQHLLWSIASRATSISWTPQAGAVPGARPSSTWAQQCSEGVAGATHPGRNTSQGQGCCDEVRAGPGCKGSSASTSSTPTSNSWSSVGGGCTGSNSWCAMVSTPACTSLSAGSSGALEGNCLAQHASTSHSLSWQPWDSLRPEILANVVAQAGHSAEVARTVSQVCYGWRLAVRQERGMLRLLRFGRLQRAGGAVARTGCGPAGGRCSSRLPLPLPWLALEAARAGSLSAAVVSARYLERESHRFPDLMFEAMCLWGKAGRRGHPEGQAKLGLAFYKGTMGLACDCEEAVVWLTRAAKQLVHLLSTSQGQESRGEQGERAAHSCASVPSASATPVHAPAPPAACSGVEACRAGCVCSGGSRGAQLRELLMGRQQCRGLLAQVAHILGLLHLDGEGTKTDFGTGIKWLKLAESHGCSQAGTVVGSLYNTGQYG